MPCRPGLGRFSHVGYTWVMTLFWRILLLVVLVALVALVAGAGCEPDGPATPVDLSKRQEAGVEPPRPDITYAYLPQYSHRVSYARHHKLVAYLAEATGLSVRQVFPGTFDEHLKMVSQGLVDVSFVNPLMMVKLADGLGARPFAKVVEPGGRDGFRGQVVCRADNPGLQNVQDVRGRRWIAVDPSSAGGYLFPLGLFLDNGIQLQDFSEVAFAPGPGGKQEKVVLAVFAGKYDIGTIREGTLELLTNKIDLSQIRVLATTPWYPGWGFAARAGLDPAIQDRVAAALLALDQAKPEDAEILKAAGMERVLPASNGDFVSVRRLMQTLGPHVDWE